MFKMFQRIAISTSFLVLLFLSSAYTQHSPSDERGDPAFRIKTNINESLINTTIFNFGLTGRESGSFPISEQTPYEWPKFSNQVYLALTGILIGGEVIDEDNNTIHIVDVMDYRTSPIGETWNFEPVPGYYNLNTGEIANSINQNSWPEFWPDRLDDPNDPGWAGSWDGYLGKNIFIDGQELYFKISDDLYDRYNYYPDSTDLTRKGLGLLIKCRFVEMTDSLFKDIVFHIYQIKNDGTKKINKATFCLWFADFVGGNGDSQDDQFRYDIANNLIYSMDKDGIAPDFGNDPVGMVGAVLIASPKNILSGQDIGMTSVNIVPAGGLNLSDDDFLWNELMQPNNFDDTTSLIGEWDGFSGSSFFSLEPGEIAEFAYAIVLGNGENIEQKLNQLYSNVELAKFLYKNKFDTTGILSEDEINEVPYNFHLSQNYPNPFNPSTTIEFGIAKTSLVKLTIYDLLGQKIQQLTNDVLNPGRYKLTFDGSKLSSGVYFYKLEAGNFIATKKLLLLK
jgi:hypothetical protein